MLLERGTSFVAATERAQRLREAVVGLAKLRKERDGALEMRDCVGVPALARRDAPQAELAYGRSGRLRRQRLVRSRARVEVTSVEQRLCHPRSCRQQRGRQPERLLKRHGRVGGPHQTLQHHAVQVPPVRTGRRQHLSPLIGEVCRFPLLPRLKCDAEPSGGRGVSRVPLRFGECGFERRPGVGGERLERDDGQRRQLGLDPGLRDRRSCGQQRAEEDLDRGSNRLHGSTIVRKSESGCQKDVVSAFRRTREIRLERFFTVP